jgi:hypothetical protein
MSEPSALHASVLAAVTRGEAARRQRHAALVLRWLAPSAAGAAFVFAVAARIAGAPPAVVVAGLAAILVATLVAVVVLRRAREVSDPMASRLDADAGLGGELRSARWFAVAEARDPWATLHLSRAATRLEAWDWQPAYPRVRARAAWAGAVLLGLGALVVSFRMPPGLPPMLVPGGVDAPGPEKTVTLTREEQAQLEAMLANMDLLKLTPEEAKRLAELSELLAKSDLGQDGSLAELMKRLQEQAERAGAQAQAGAPKTGDERPAQAMKNAEDVREALENLKARLASGQPVDQTPEGGQAQASEESARGDAAATAAEASMKLVREPASEQARGEATLGGGAMGGDSGPGRGGQGPGRGLGRGQLLSAEMLRKELVEAAADTSGANVPAEDIRRKTEQSTSTLNFSRVAPRSSYDRSRTAPPPPVPDARRTWVQRYFIRK